jgi:hypothetical protein
LLAAAAGLIAVALAAILVPAAANAGPGGASTSTLTNGGVLQLHLGSTGTAPQDYFGFRDADPTQPTGYATSFSQTQAIGTSSGCRLALTPPSSLVTFSSSAPTSSFPGFVSDAIGVRTNSEGNGQPCGRIDAPGQVLTMDLTLAGKVIDYAELDIELKFGGSVTVTGYMGGDQVGSPQNYGSGAASDSGPDSGDGDNYRIRFPKTGFTTINRLVFSIDGSTGGASLEGGADGTQACDPGDLGECGTVGFSLGQTLHSTDSLFHLINADGILDCGDTATQTNAGITTTVARLDNITGTCTPIPYNQDSSSTCTGGFLQCIFLQKDLDGQQVQFFWKVTWAPEPGDYMVHPTQFDFGDGRGYVDLQICGPSTGSVDPPIPGFPSFYPTPSSDPWCVVDTQSNLQPDGQVVVTETYFGQNDPSGHR